MYAKKYRHIESGEAFNSLFPKADGNFITVKKAATVSDTVKFIPKVVRATLYQTKGISAQIVSEVGSKNLPAVAASRRRQIAERIWNFIYKHIRYAKDEEGFEQIRAPSRTWADRHKGVDCDCYTVFISSILSNLKIPHVLRITKYHHDYFQHIYPVAFDEEGKEIIIDCVVDEFNYEEPYTEKKDFMMDLQYLSGVNDMSNDEKDYFPQVGELGKINIGEKLKKAVNLANKFNPGTALLRNGFLITMRINMFKIAQRLKWAYLAESEVRKRGLDVGKWKKLVAIKDKLENMHYMAGGKKEDLKKAILTGKGNKNKEVAGLFGVSGDDFILNGNTPLEELMGAELFESERESIQGLEGLGEPVTAASITAATAALASIAAILKSVGNIFPPKSKEGEDFKNVETEGTAVAQSASGQATIAAAAPPPPMMASAAVASDSDSAPATTNTNTGVNDSAKAESFWNKNKKWLKPTAIGLGILTAVGAGYKMMQSKKAAVPLTSTTPTSPPLSGTGKKKKTSSKKDKGGGQLRSIELM